MIKRIKFQTGFTLIELLVVLAILGILAITVLWALTSQLSRSRDGRRKSDIARLKTAFEDYYNDNDCYPTPAEYSSWECQSRELSPYLDRVPCDPTTKELYTYITPANSCSGYALLTKLERTSDPAIEDIGCSEDGCGLYEENYGLSTGLPLERFVTGNL